MSNGHGGKVLVRSRKGRMMAGVCAGPAGRRRPWLSLSGGPMQP